MSNFDRLFCQDLVKLVRYLTFDIKCPKTKLGNFDSQIVKLSTLNFLKLWPTCGQQLANHSPEKKVETQKIVQSKETPNQIKSTNLLFSPQRIDRTNRAALEFQQAFRTAPERQNVADAFREVEEEILPAGAVLGRKATVAARLRSQVEQRWPATKDFV